MQKATCFVFVFCFGVFFFSFFFPITKLNLQEQLVHSGSNVTEKYRMPASDVSVAKCLITVTL